MQIKFIYAVIKVNKEKEEKFHITDAEPFVEAVKQMKTVDDQSPEIFALHVDSVGAAFREALNAGKTVGEAVKAEIETLKKVYLEPTEAQAELMDKVGYTSFDHRAYMKRYKERIKATVKKAIDTGPTTTSIQIEE